MNNESQKITPFLWFDDQAEEAAQFYTSLSDTGKIGSVTRYNEAGNEIHGQPAGKVMTVDFEVDGYRFVGLNGGPMFQFTPAISFFMHCDSKDQLQARWDRLIEGGKALMPLDRYDWSELYGWVQDRYGLTWQLMLADGSAPPYRIVPSFMFAGPMYGQAEEAIHHYTSIFTGAKSKQIFRYGPGHEPNREEAIMYADFLLENQVFAAMESADNHDFGFTEAVSLHISCDNQDEVDYYWEELTQGGDPEAQQCGWLKDRFGVSWQVVPSRLGQMLNTDNIQQAERVTDAYMQMKKIDLAQLEDAFRE